METLLIHVPERKRKMVKQLLKELGVTIEIPGDDVKPSAHDFLGRFSFEDAEAINKAIEEGCE